MESCASCGAQRLPGEQICRHCGQQHPAAAPPPPPAFTPMAPPLSGPPSGPPTGPPAGPPPNWTPGAAPPQRSGRSTGLLLGVIGAVLALVAGVFVVWQFVLPKGGAGSPEDAVEQLIEAAAGQDPLAMLDVLAPGEVDALSGVIEKVRDRAEEEELVESDSLTDAIEIELTNLEFDVDELGDNLARVQIVDGDYDVSWDPEQLPERLSFLEDVSEEDSDSGELSDLFDGEDIFLTTVQVDGRWYVTALGTIAEYAYADAEGNDDVDRPDYHAADDGIDPIVGEEPEDVIEGLLEAISDGEVDDILASLPKDVGLPLRPYVGIVEDALDGRFSDGERLDVDLSVEDLDLEAEDLGDDKVKVVIAGGTFTGTAREGDDDSDTASITFDGRCVTGQGAGFEEWEYTDGYIDEYGEYVEGEEELVDDSQEWCFGNGDDVSDVFDEIGFDEYFVVMAKVDGGYQLDPFATIAEYASLAVEAIDEGLIEDLLGEWEDDL